MRPVRAFVVALGVLVTVFAWLPCEAAAAPILVQNTAVPSSDVGEYRHREVALQEVRFAVEDVTKGIEFEHRLMDYNNLASTKFEDIKHVLKVATDRVSSRLAAQKLKK